VAEALAARGAKVAVVDRNEAAAGEVAKAIGGLALAFDVADSSAAEASFARVAAELGAPRILVNCAGIGIAKRVLGKDGPQPLADFEQVIRVNLLGSFNTLRLATVAMSKLEPLDGGERGVVINTASIAAFEGQVGQAAYSASKGGIVAMTLPIARELAQFGIRVNAIAPGLFSTPLLRALPEEVQASLAKSIPFPPRLGEPSEFALLALHIITNPFLNGEVVRLDGALRLPPR
jgi:NAD(P)-dependent dehydrogenase (short-subunit alcohol dehydrogenase family)